MQLQNGGRQLIKNVNRLQLSQEKYKKQNIEGSVKAIKQNKSSASLFKYVSTPPNKFSNANNQSMINQRLNQVMSPNKSVHTQVISPNKSVNIYEQLMNERAINLTLSQKIDEFSVKILIADELSQKLLKADELNQNLTDQNAKFQEKIFLIELEVQYLQEESSKKQNTSRVQPPPTRQNSISREIIICKKDENYSDKLQELNQENENMLQQVIENEKLIENLQQELKKMELKNKQLQDENQELNLLVSKMPQFESLQNGIEIVAQENAKLIDINEKWEQEIKKLKEMNMQKADQVDPVDPVLDYQIIDIQNSMQRESNSDPDILQQLNDAKEMLNYYQTLIEVNDQNEKQINAVKDNNQLLQKEILNLKIQNKALQDTIDKKNQIDKNSSPSKSNNQSNIFTDNKQKDNNQNLYTEILELKIQNKNLQDTIKQKNAYIDKNTVQSQQNGHFQNQNQSHEKLFQENVQYQQKLNIMSQDLISKTNELNSLKNDLKSLQVKCNQITESQMKLEYQSMLNESQNQRNLVLIEQLQKNEDIRIKEVQNCQDQLSKRESFQSELIKQMESLKEEFIEKHNENSQIQQELQSLQKIESKENEQIKLLKLHILEIEQNKGDQRKKLSVENFTYKGESGKKK